MANVTLLILIGNELELLTVKYFSSVGLLVFTRAVEKIYLKIFNGSGFYIKTQFPVLVYAFVQHLTYVIVIITQKCFFVATFIS